MPKTNIRTYQEKNGVSPLLEWLDSIPEKARIKCIGKIERLEMFGYDLRRPHCDILEPGIYELRAKYQNVNYRILYGFTGENIVLLSHGCTKKAKVPKIEIRRACKNLEMYNQEPEAHTYKGEW